MSRSINRIHAITNDTPTKAPVLKVQDRHNLSDMSRSLRRLKRKMFLQAVEEPIRPVDNFRSALLTLALDDSFSSIDTNDHSSSSNGSSILSAIQEE
eukprot:CAMPEP_0119013506 /NCGR_PEP_ID=MMETSP1176-20130426/8485_1 /TAXON_ID=265551 /ORGANISM="Synedropsis recta cf, Strain CCMP1620" /LENGTH=96 /DNA_ID=CAMNT_0006966599 /DNA_START=56 /DNA_END=346 /DNA_ORIENTATION=+